MRTTTNERKHRGALGSALAAAGLAVELSITGCTAGTNQAPSTPDHTATAPTSPGGISQAASATARVPTAGTERYIVVGSRHFAARCDGSGPAVILVADYGRSMDDTGPALHNLTPNAQACLYDRLGVGRSDSASRLQTFTSLADDLDGVSSGLKLTQPVVVLGDGFGAPIALTWASRHAKDARAVVLINPDPPGFRGPRGALARLLPPKDPGDVDLSNLWIDLDHFNDPARNRESLDPRSWDAYLRLGSSSTPLYDLIGLPSPTWPASVDAKKVNGAWQQGQSRVLRLSSSSELLTVAHEADWPAALTRTLQRAVQN
ncbi:alpha/beta fold hydrolase [Terrabacter sp. BE26]|uniref:alpha/beta fold hydrolase n=1 Tax=Terrabacter sp. BE26 TaxID=2898152 RepID=UPI0035BE2CA1